MSADMDLFAAAETLARGGRVTVELDNRIVQDLIAGHLASRWRRADPPTLSLALYAAAAAALQTFETRAKLDADLAALATAQERQREQAERRRRLTAAEVERLRSEGFPTPDDGSTRTRNYYLPLAQAQQMLPDPVPVELDALFVRALEHYHAERVRAGLPLGCDAEPLADSVGRLLWAALNDAAAALRRDVADAEAGR